MDNLQVNISITVRDLNQLLLIISKEPLKDVLDLFKSLKIQGDAQAAAFQEKIRMATQEPVRGGPILDVSDINQPPAAANAAE